MTSGFIMRAPCRCGGLIGTSTETNGQDVVRCASCNGHCYNRPRVESGRAVRSVTTVHNGIKPKQRARIIARGGAKCEVCGGRGDLHVGHIVSADAGLRFGLTELELNDDENLLCLCAECNLGGGKEPIPLRVAIVVLRARISWRNREEPS